MSCTGSHSRTESRFVVPNRLVGQPRLRWDDYLRMFFREFFILERHTHWLQMILGINNVTFEERFINFVMSSA